jgi:uncharacterized membrane protein (DUF4010 family)
MPPRKKEASQNKKPVYDSNLAGIMLTFVSVALLALFFFALFTPAYRTLALTIPVAVFTTIALGALAAVGWEISRSQYEE